MSIKIRQNGAWKEIEAKCQDPNECQYSVKTVIFSRLQGGDTQTIVCGFKPSHVMLGKRYIMTNANSTGIINITEDDSFNISYTDNGYTVAYKGGWVFGNTQYTDLSFVFIAFK